MSINKRPWSLALALIAVLVFVGILIWHFYQKSEASYLQASGRIESDEIHIVSKFPTKVLAVQAKEGDTVHKGQLLIKLDAKDIKAKVSEVSSGLKVAQNLEQQAQLKKNALQEENEKVQASSKTLIAHLLPGKKKRTEIQQKLQYGIGETELAISTAKAQQAKAQAIKEEIDAQMSYFNMVSPIDGICVTRAVEPGDLVLPGQILLSLYDPNSIYLRAFIPEGKIVNVKIGQAAKIFLDAASSKPYAGKIVEIDTQPSFTPENVYFKQDRVRQVFGIKIAITQPDGFAKPGMSADARIMLANPEQYK